MELVALLFVEAFHGFFHPDVAAVEFGSDAFLFGGDVLQAF